MANVFKLKSSFLTLFWLILGGILRLSNINTKPLWTDEFASILYARGDDYSTIPIAQIISAAELLEPLKGYPVYGWQRVSELLIQHNNHPPLYFLIVNTWQRLFPLDPAGYVSIYSTRYLSAFVGIFAILSLYWVAKTTFKSERIAQFSAALIAFSPFHIYLSQEARHYTLMTTLVIFSLGYCLYYINYLIRQKSFSAPFIFSWLGLNICGLLSHYFFGLTIIAEAIALIWLLWRKTIFINKLQLLQLVFVVMGVGSFSLIWITQILPVGYGSTMTDWIRLDMSNWLDFIWPIVQLFYVLMTMIFLLPVQASLWPIAIVSFVIIAIFSIQLYRLWQQSNSNQIIKPQYQALIFFLNRFIVSIWGLFAILTYRFGYDITRGARYSFVYFPAIILLVAITICSFWQQEIPIYFPLQKIFSCFSQSGCRAIAAIFCCSFLGGVSVITNLAYQKPYNPTSIIQKIAVDNQPALILTAYKSTVQTGEMMAIAWEKHQRSSPSDISFTLVPFQTNPKKYDDEINQLTEIIDHQQFKLWVLNLENSLTPKLCEHEQRTRQAGYYGHIYQCTKN
ncbi:glycosyltransferase family 39 protein [[Limnothrix rosea] IAM M-220]|uniref:glycosyltransferase family 39 protein n=1 Tax=[Limnothrix rosea] IAM M-220 TaxID=454133 RepID=UPI0009631BCC|nr:glycosyltransferase family 39 protein [[Limnothrix rosea] IAM M-220]OKH17031.1 hypothetical protein NIES208_11115 [[Limnothrix rosea] IAM M-220]